MLEEDEKDHPTQLPSSDQGQYIDYFQNVAYKVYSSLLERVWKIIPAICTPHFADNSSQI